MGIRLNTAHLVVASGLVVILLTGLALATNSSDVHHGHNAQATPDNNSSSTPQSPSLSMGMQGGITPPLYMQLTWVAMAQTHSSQATHQTTPASGLEGLPLCPDEVYTLSLTATPVPDLSGAPATCRLNSVEYDSSGPISLPCCGTLAPYVQLTLETMALTPTSQATHQVTPAGGLEDLPICSDEVYTPSLTATPVPDLSDAPATCRLNFTEQVGSGPP